MSPADLDAEPVLRCAYRLEQVASDVRTAAARTAGAYPEHWRGDAGIAYQQRLDETADRVRRVAVAYDAAGAALVPYAQALLDAQELARRAAGLLAEADEADRRCAVAAALQGGSRLAGPSPAEGLRAAAARYSAEAAEVERRAAAVCASALDGEASRAPRTSGWRAVDRFVGDLTRVGVDSVVGAASLLGNAWHALPGVGSRHSRHEARHGLADAAVAAVQVWKIPGDIRQAWEDGRPGLAVETVASVLGPGKLSKLEKHRIRDPFLAHKEAFREADRRAVLAGQSRHAAARSFDVSPSCVIKLMQQFATTGGCLPRKFGGHKRHALAAHEAKVRALVSPS